MAVKTNLKVSTVSYVILYVKDTQKATEFYRDTLGLKVKTSEDGWVELDTGATTLALHGEKAEMCANQAERGPGKTTVVFNVDDVRAAYDALKSAGVKHLHEPKKVCETPHGDGYSVDFEDFDGNLLSVYGMEQK